MYKCVSFFILFLILTWKFFTLIYIFFFFHSFLLFHLFMFFFFFPLFSYHCLYLFHTSENAWPLQIFTEHYIRSNERLHVFPSFLSYQPHNFTIQSIFSYSVSPTHNDHYYSYNPCASLSLSFIFIHTYIYTYSSPFIFIFLPSASFNISLGRRVTKLIYRFY